MDGLRTSRTDGTKTYSYIYNGGTLSQMTVGSDTLTFTYDASGRPLSITLNGTTYYYVTNLQGDVTAILNSSGTAVVNYTYDAWGNPLTNSGDLATTLGTLNPLRYRGYVYDTETGIYYVSSRYYSPDTERFLNADILVSTGQGILGNNMFAYCRNNPVSRRDISGNNDEDCLSDKQDEDLVPDISGGGSLPSGDHGIQVGTVGNSGNGGVSGGQSPQTGTGSVIPKEAYAIRDYVLDHNGSPPPGYKGGKEFANDGRNGSQVLPNMYSPFREYDIYPKTIGVSRGSARIVIGNGISWYTNDHYMTFFEMGN